MARHRLNTPVPFQAVTQVHVDTTSRIGGAAQHRAARSSAVPAAATAGAFVAVAGALGLSVGGAAQAAAQPPAIPINIEEAISSLPAIPAMSSLPSDLALPAPLDDVVRDLLPPHLFQPGGAVTATPASGTLTSGYGARWGSNHNGVDIAADIGTPVYAVTDGTVLESGPADGFGQWVRVQQDDGTIGVFGHVDESFVSPGQQVKAGEQIATVGNRGQSTGPHLHYEVWAQDGSKIDPEVWLNNRGVSIA